MAEPPARSCGRARRHQQRRAVAGLRRGPLRHRRRRCRSTPGSARSGGRRTASAVTARRGRRATVVGRQRELDLVLAAVVGRPRPPARGPAGDVEEHDPAGDHRELGHPAPVRRGQRRADTGEARRPPQPGPGAARGLQRRELRARARWWRRCSAAASSTSRSSTGRRRTHSTRSSRRWPSGDRGAARRQDPRLPRFRVVASMNPFDNVGTTRISASTTGCAGSPSTTSRPPRTSRSWRCAPAPTTALVPTPWR